MKAPTPYQVKFLEMLALQLGHAGLTPALVAGYCRALERYDDYLDYLDYVRGWTGDDPAPFPLWLSWQYPIGGDAIEADWQHERWGHVALGYLPPDTLNPAGSPPASSAEENHRE